MLIFVHLQPTIWPPFCLKVGFVQLVYHHPKKGGFFPWSEMVENGGVGSPRRDLKKRVPKPWIVAWDVAITMEKGHRIPW